MTKKAKADQPDPRLTELEQQVSDLTSALQRERADAINLRRRHDDEIAGLRTSAKAAVVRELLPVIDNFERALKHIPKGIEDNDFVKGVQGIVRQFEKTLEQMGVTKINTVGEPFDPQLHEAVSIEGESDGQEVITEEIQAGYTLGDQVLRHAMVRVKAG